MNDTDTKKKFSARFYDDPCGKVVGHEPMTEEKLIRLEKLQRDVEESRRKAKEEHKNK